MKSTSNRRLDAAASAWSLAARLLGLVMVWLGAMKLLPFGIEAMGRLLGQYPWLPSPAYASVVSIAAGVLGIVIGLLLALSPTGRWRGRAGLAAALYWGFGLLLLLGPAAWIRSPPYDGFPVIGSGQTLIKHLGIATIGFGLWTQYVGSARGQRLALYGLWLGQLLVLVWIGLMKFTHVEAEGVEGVMRPSPLFNWLYRLFDAQGASNVIGVIELVTAGLIALWPWRPRLARWGLLLAIGTYMLTSTFLVTTPGWQDGYGFPFVGGTGQFLLKDLLLLAGALILLCMPPPPPTRTRAPAMR